jgi:uncharacterized protein (TIGR02266 family)
MSDDESRANGADASVTRPIEQAIGIDVAYRSRGAFLVAYATNLGKGGLFIETAEPLDIGTPVTLRLTAPAVDPIAVEGVVTWTRPTAAGPGQPAGVGVALVAPPEALGDVVDDIAFGFGGMKVLLGAGEAAPRAILSRYLRSILRCEIVEADSERDAGAGTDGLDLAVIDLDSSGQQGLDLYARLRANPHTRSVPALALAHIERDRSHALRAGFDEAQPNPPVFAELQAAVLRCLARPLTNGG